MVGEAAENNSVSIHAILQNPIVNYHNMDFVVTTESGIYCILININI